MQHERHLRLWASIRKWHHPQEAEEALRKMRSVYDLPSPLPRSYASFPLAPTDSPTSPTSAPICSMLPISSAPIMASNCLPPGCGNPVESTGDVLESPSASPTRARPPPNPMINRDGLQRFPPPDGLATLGKEGIFWVYAWLYGRVALAQGREAEARACFEAFATVQPLMLVSFPILLFRMRSWCIPIV